MTSTQKKFNNIYDYIQENEHFCSDDATFGSKGRNAALLLGMITALTNQSILYVGEYGMGKTTLSETISSLIFSLPKNIIESSSIKGNPELSYEQLIGRPDLGELNNGKEKVLWSNFVYSKPKIVDEINRIPEHKQNILLTGMQTNSWKYMNSFFLGSKGPWFATKNYKDSGNNGVIPPLLDRFTLSVEVKNPGINAARLIRFNKGKNLSYEDMFVAHETILQQEDISNDIYKQGVKYLQEEFQKRIKNDVGIELLTSEELSDANNEIENIKFDNDSNYLLDIINSELGSCQLYGQKRTHDECPDDCHYTNYACYKTNNSISVRTIKAIDFYSKAIAWLEGKNKVNSGIVESILPYALWHKTSISEDELEQNSHRAREEPLEFHTMKQISEDICKRGKKVKKHQEAFTQYVLNNEFNKATAIADKQDHPVFKEYKK